MSKTGLAFYRKHQTLVDLENERPKSMATIREAIKVATEALEVRIHDLELQFYGSRRAEDDLRNILPPIRNIMTVFQVTYIHASYQVENIMRLASDPTEVFKADRHDLEFLKDYHRRLVEFVPENFVPFIEDFRKIFSYVEKYCVSFYDGGVGPEMETAFHYHLKQKEYREAINVHLSNITSMASAYRDEAGLNVKHFGLSTNELARRCDCGDLPFLLVFPEAIQNILMACQAIYTWLKDDIAYIDLIKYDVEKVKEKRDGVAESFKRNKTEHALMDRRIRNTRKELSQLETELEELKPREKQVKKEVKFLRKEIRNKELDIELLQQKRSLLEGDAKFGNIHSKECEQIAANILQSRYAIPEIQKQVDIVHARANFITQKKETLEEKKKSLSAWEAEYDLQKNKLVLEEKNLKRLDKCVAQVKDIYQKKTSPDLAKKIFHNMPVEARNARLLPKGSERMIRKGLCDYIHK